MLALRAIAELLVVLPFGLLVSTTSGSSGTTINVATSAATRGAPHSAAPSPTTTASPHPTPNPYLTTRPPEEVVSAPAGWNILSGSGAGGFVSIAAPVFTWQAGDAAYELVRRDATITLTAGYWVHFGGPVTFSIGTSLAGEEQVALPAGQYILIGNPFGVPSEVSGAEVIYTYDPAAGYEVTTRLQPGQGAWAYSAAGGTLTFTPDESACILTVNPSLPLSTPTPTCPETAPPVSCPPPATGAPSPATPGATVRHIDSSG